MNHIVSRIQKDETLLHKNICGVVRKTQTLGYPVLMFDLFVCVSQSVLHGAAYLGRGDTVKALLEMGADAQLADSIGRVRVYPATVSHN